MNKGRFIQNHYNPEQPDFDDHYEDPDRVKAEFPYGKKVGKPGQPASTNLTPEILEDMGYVGLYEPEQSQTTTT